MTLCRADEAPDTAPHRPGEGAGRRWRKVASTLRRRVGRRRPSPGPASPAAATIASANGTHRRPAPALRWRNPARAPGGDYAALAITNAALTGAIVPRPGDPWDKVSDFCLSYDGHAYWDDLPELANRARQRWTRDGTLPDTLDELRGCLFYERRRWHHFGEEPGERSSKYLRGLIDALRDLAPPAGATPVPSANDSGAAHPTPPAAPAGRPTLVDPRVRIAPEAHVRLIPPSGPSRRDDAPSPPPAVTVLAVGSGSSRIVPLHRAAEAHVSLVDPIEGATNEAKARHPSARRPATSHPSPDPSHPSVVTELRPMPSAEALAKPPVIDRRSPRGAGRGEETGAVIATLHRTPPGTVDRRSATAHGGPCPDDLPGVNGAVVFDHDDDGYRAWLATHPAGFVLNVRASAASAASVLHRSGCPAIAPAGPARRTTARSPKVCGDASTALVRWSSARGETSACCRRCLG